MTDLIRLWRVPGRWVLLAIGMLGMLLVPAPCSQAVPAIGGYQENAATWAAGTFGLAELTGTGTDFDSAYSPATAANFIRFRVTANVGENWAVSASRTDPWSASPLSVILGGQGDPAVTSPVGTTLVLSNTPARFFVGTGTCGNVTRMSIDLSIGVTVVAGPGSYTTTITFTVAQIV